MGMAHFVKNRFVKNRFVKNYKGDQKLAVDHNVKCA